MRSRRDSSAAQGEDYFVEDSGRRFPVITKRAWAGTPPPEAFAAALPFLTENDQKVLIDNWPYITSMMTPGREPDDHAEVQRRNPDLIGLAYPAVELLECHMYDAMTSVITGVDIVELRKTSGDATLFPAGLPPESLPYLATAHLMILKTAHDMDVEWTQQLMGTAPNPSLSRQQMGLLGHPRSTVWNDQQRLTLLFTEGVLHQNLSDELFAQGKKAWGSKRTAVYARWITYYVGLLLLTVANITDAESSTRSDRKPVVDWMSTT